MLRDPLLSGTDANLVAAANNDTMPVCVKGPPEGYSNPYTGTDPNLCDVPLLLSRLASDCQSEWMRSAGFK